MPKNLVIVESPTKAKTISKYLGRGYTVRASMGHVRDLPKTKLGVEVEDEFRPQYLVPRDKTKIVKELKEAVKESDTVFLATDPDREGEAIAWHVALATGADPARVRRVVFHEITKDAVSAAVKQPRDIDMKLVDAQQARRILDRLVGYKISPLLWKNVKKRLSAGRVQSVALRLVVDREREIEAFVPEESWSIEADLAKMLDGRKRKRTKSEIFRATLQKIRGEKADLKNAEQAQKIVADLQDAVYVVADVRQKENRRGASPPFTTSTMQQEASRKLNFTAKRTMVVAQQLYEGIDLGAEGTTGLITYMRTDSTNVAYVAQQEARDYIGKRYGADHVPERPNVYTRKAKGAQEAHEAIRPTSVRREPDAIKRFLTAEQYKLYRLVWQRFVASQMAAAIFDSTTVDINAGPAGSAEAPYLFRTTGSKVKFMGFLAVYFESKDEGQPPDELDKEALPPLDKGEALDLVQLVPEQHFTQPPPRYTEATLVKVLEEEGIGRPSTYAPILATLQERQYVTRQERKLVPTELGFAVSDVLVEHFPDIMNVGFTSQMEEELDEVASGDRSWVPMLQDFYGPFARTVAQAEQTMEKVKVADEPAGVDCEKCGRPMVIKFGRFGKFIACTGFPECRNTKPLLAKIGVTCPECGEGDVVQRKTKRSRVFFGCSRYPECAFSSWDRPTGQVCPDCGGPIVQTAKRELKCSKCKRSIGGLAVTA